MKSCLLLLSLLLTTPVLALTNQQVTEKLNTIPAFALVNKEGKPLVVPVFPSFTMVDNDGKAMVVPFLDPSAKLDLGVVTIFTSSQLAERNCAEFKKAAPDKGDVCQVAPLPLGKAFEAARSEQERKDSKVRFYFQPSVPAKELALTLAQKKEAKLREFPGIPIFFVGKEGEPLVFSKDSAQFRPFFFSAEDANREWEQIKKNKPEVGAQISVQVMNLYQLVSFMLDQKNDKDAQTITFVPDASDIKFAQEAQKNSPKSSATKSPAPSVSPSPEKPTEEAPKP